MTNEVAKISPANPGWSIMTLAIKFEGVSTSWKGPQS
eukprot:00939.XXX_2094_2204_1 [CDS] Oithona nana genome sequencing.